MNDAWSNPDPTVSKLDVLQFKDGLGRHRFRKSYAI
jgi:hypothetical protein